MKNSWLKQVLGESSQPETVAKPSPSAVKQVIGEEEGAEPAAEPPPSGAAPTASEEPADGPGAAEAEAEVDAGGMDRVNSPVQALASLWSSGAKMDVAVKLLSEPISNRNFVELILAIGGEGAIELGQILDDMQAGAEEGDPEEDAVLSRVAQMRGKRGTSPEEEERGDFRERHAAGDPTAIAQGEQ
jgi:hypothetical protein